MQLTPDEAKAALANFDATVQPAVNRIKASLTETANGTSASPFVISQETLALCEAVVKFGLMTDFAAAS